MQAYDAVVIGAGNGGLTAAATMAQKGLNVLLLERQNNFRRRRHQFLPRAI